MKKILCVLFLMGFILTSCEKDDICDPSTPTTPRLVVKFYDFNNPSVLKRISTLKIIGDGMSDDNPVLTPQGNPIWNDTVAYIPLRINLDSSKFRFIINAQDTDVTNDIEDKIEFNYTRRDTYISRACGFKTTFDLFGDPLRDPFILNETENNTSGAWIKNIEVEQSNINDENETHIKIYLL